MNSLGYMTGGEVVMRPAEQDRFYLDLSVYEVREYELDPVKDAEHLIWRGLYLAIKTPPKEADATPRNMMNGLWN